MGAAVAALAIWYGIVLVARLVTRPAMPKGVPATMDLRPEPPALVEFLVGEWEPGRSAVTATLIDLAARHLIEFQQVGPDPKSTVIRMLPNGAAGAQDVPLLPYEQRVLHRVQALASGGVVPAAALAQGTESQDKAWWRAFAKQVVADAKQRGLSRDRFRPALRLVLAILALGPAALTAVAVIASGIQGRAPVVAGGVVFVAAFAVVASLQGQRETADGQAACAHWLGVRAWLSADEVFPTLPPASVTMWDRYLAYGAAVGVARTASAALPFGPRDEHRAWSTFGGAWHEVRLHYKPVRVRRLRRPRSSAVYAVFWIALWAAAIRGLIFLDSRNFFPGIPRTTESLVLLGVGVVAGLIALFNVLILIAALHDLIVRDEITGEIVRLRHIKGENRSVYHAAIDPGGVRRVLAWPVRYEVYQKLDEGDTVKAVRGAWLGYTYSIDVTRASGRGRVFESDTETMGSAASGGAPLFTSAVPDPKDFMPCDEAAAILGIPLTEPAQNSTPTVPVLNSRVRIYTVREANGSKGRVVVQSATGAVARRMFSVFARNGQPLPGLGEEAYARDQTVAVRRGETIVIIRVVGAIAADAPQRLASAAVARL